MTKIPLTAPGAQRLREELQRLISVERPRIINAIAEARAHGEKKENCGYRAAVAQKGCGAGGVAEMFRIITGLCPACCVLRLICAAVSSGAGARRRWRSVVVVVMMMAAALILFVLQPQMAALKTAAAAAGAPLGPEFGRLHGISSALYLLASVLGVFLAASGPQGRGR